MVLRYDQKSRETLNLKFVGFGKAYRMQGARRYMLPVAVWPVTSLVHACNHALVHADVSLKRRVVYGHFFFFPTAIPRNTNHFSASPTRLRLSASQLPSSILLQFVILYRIDISFFFQTVFFFEIIQPPSVSLQDLKIKPLQITSRIWNSSFWEEC